MNYNQFNEHERDRFISFEPIGHIYTVKGEVYSSVTTVIDSYFPKFNADFWAARKASELGLTKEQLKAQWEEKGEEARNLGTLLHHKIERYYLGLPNDSDSTYEIFRQFSKKINLAPYRTEWAIFDDKHKVAGTLDFLDYQNGRFIIYDWKRSNKLIRNGIPETESCFRKTAFAPICHIPDTTYWHYALQVSVYRYILETNYGISIAGCRLAVLHPDNKRPYVVEMPYLREEIISLLENYKLVNTIDND